jgi:hypothetical protein
MRDRVIGDFDREWKGVGVGINTHKSIFITPIVGDVNGLAALKRRSSEPEQQHVAPAHAATFNQRLKSEPLFSLPDDMNQLPQYQY